VTAHHLTETARATLTLSDAERISRIRSARWIGYTRAKQILEKLENLLTYPKKHRMPNLLIVGETNNGKTMTVNRFQTLHPPSEEPEGIVLPVLVVQAPPTPDEVRFYNTILETLVAPYKPRDRIDTKQFQAIRILTRIQTRMLIIDEIQHIIAGNLNKQRNFLNSIKYIGNELQIPIVGVGTQEAFNAVQTDRQLANRFEPALLPKWQMGKEYLKLLASFERMLPLRKPSNLIGNTLALKLLSMSGGIIGELSEILSRAAVKAIETGGECITAKLLESIDWTHPLERKRMARENV